MISVDLQHPQTVSSRNFDATVDHPEFSSLKIRDAHGGVVTVFLDESNAANVLLAIADEAAKILDFLFDNQVSLDQSTEGNTK